MDNINFDSENKIINITDKLSDPKFISGLINFGIFLTSIIGIFLYTMFSPDYDSSKLFSWETCIDLVVINILLYLIKFSINNWTTTHYRNKERYIQEMKEISDNKRYIEKQGLLRQFQTYIDKLNLERKRRAKLRVIDNHINLLEKQLLKKKKENQVKKINKHLEELDIFKKSILENKVDESELNAKYNMLTRANIFAGSSLEDDRDVDIADTAQIDYHKKNLGMTLISIIITFVTLGLVFDKLANQEYGTLLTFFILALWNSIVTFSVTKYIEEQVTLPKLNVRKTICIEFKDNIQTPVNEVVEIKSNNDFKEFIEKNNLNTMEDL